MPWYPVDKKIRLDVPIHQVGTYTIDVKWPVAPSPGPTIDGREMAQVPPNNVEAEEAVLGSIHDLSLPSTGP